MKRAVILLVLIVTLTSCGASIRRTYQSDNAFERCFDMDYNPRRSPSAKEQCWSTWLGRYVYNQPEDKIAYAELRLKELGEGVSVPGPPGPPGVFDQRPALPAAADVQPEPPAEPREPSAPADVAQQVDGGPPAAACEQGCKTSRGDCLDVCGADQGCLGACDVVYRTCMKGCFAD